MPFEIPECKRCCCCLPLRYGLIAWGYIKLLTACAALVIISIIISVLLAWGPYSPSIIVILSLLIVLFTIEITSAIIFIVGCHLKNVRLMKIYYFYSMFTLALTVLLSLFVWYLIIRNIGIIIEYHLPIYYLLLLLSGGTAMLIYIGVQVYILLLVRSEIIKLKTGCQFRFVNNINEAECTLSIEQQNDLKVIEDDKEINK